MGSMGDDGVNGAGRAEGQEGSGGAEEMGCDSG